MTKDKVQFTVHLAITDGKLDEFAAIAQTMIAATQKEAGTLTYEFCLSVDRKRCRLIETYVDGNAVLTHLTGPVVQELVPRILEVSTLSGFEIYGDRGPQAAEMLTGLGAEIFEQWHGFSR